MAEAAAKTRGRGRLLFGAWSGLILALGGALWLSLQEPRGPVRVLRNGSTIELRQVTYGKEHVYREGNWWQRTLPLQPLLPLMPDWPLLNGLRGSSEPDHEHSTSADELVLWFKNQSTAPRRFSLSQEDTGWVAATIDDHGCVLPAQEDYWWGRPPGFSFDTGELQTGVAPAALQVRPKRTAGFRYVLISQNDTRRLEFPVRTPVLSQAKPWAGAACPVAAQAGDTRFVLRRLTHVTGLHPVAQAKADFEYFEAGHPVDSWQPESVTVLDATGNELTSGQSYPAPNDELTFDALCRFETAWKLRVRFARTEKFAIATGDVWRLRDIPAPHWDQLTQIGLTRKLGDVTLELQRVIGGGPQYGDAEVHLSADAPNGTVLLSLVECADQSGRKLAPRFLPIHAVERSDPGCVFRFAPFSAATRKLSLTFAVHRTRTVEFLVKP